MKRYLPAGVLLLLFSLGFFPWVEASVEFEEYQIYEVGTGPECLNTADVDGDGDQDMVMISSGDGGTTGGSLIYLINSGDGEFVKRSEALSNTPYLLDLQDMDGDGDVDIVLVDNASVRILSNSGTGEFTETWSHELTTLLYSSLTARDLNGDGRADIAFFDGVSLHLFLSTTTDYSHVEQDVNKTTYITWYDMDGDGDTDVLKTFSGVKLFGEWTDTPKIEVYLNQGNGTFTSEYSRQVDYMPGLVAVGPGDEGVRVYIQDCDRNSVKVYRWETGNMTYIGEKGSEGDFETMYSMKLYDVDADGEDELLVLGTVNFMDRLIRIHDEVGSVDYPVTAATTDFTVFMANGDSLPDLAGWEGYYMFTSGNMVWVALQRGDRGEENASEGGGNESAGGEETAGEGSMGSGNLLLYVGASVAVAAGGFTLLRRLRSGK